MPKSEGIAIATFPTIVIRYCTVNEVQEPFTSDRNGIKEINIRIDKANTVLRELYRAVVTKRELSNTAKLSVIKPIFVPILTYG